MTIPDAARPADDEPVRVLDGETPTPPPGPTVCQYGAHAPTVQGQPQGGACQCGFFGPNRETP